MKSFALPAGLLVVLGSLAGCGSGPGGTTGPTATRLVITNQPGTGTISTALSPALTVEIRDADNDRLTGSSATVTVRLVATGSTNHLSGTVSRRAFQGVATFTDLAVDSTGEFILIAKSGTLDSAISGPIDIVPPASVPTAIEIAVGSLAAATQYRSTRNGSINPAVDTVAVTGSVTWTWLGGLHGVHSTGAKTFVGSDTTSVPQTEYTLTFNSTGTYAYNCSVHGDLMNGRVVVK